MSSIMRRRRGLISAIGKLLSEGLGFENPRSSQTGGSYCDPSLIAAPAASFNPEDEIAGFRAPKACDLKNPAAPKTDHRPTGWVLFHRRLLNVRLKNFAHASIRRRLRRQFQPGALDHRSRTASALCREIRRG